jgi:hypothetical protein
MCGAKGGGDAAAESRRVAEEARQREEDRQRQLSMGLQDIDGLFTRGVATRRTENPAWADWQAGRGANGGPAEGPEPQRYIESTENTGVAFDDNFFARRGQAYRDWATPQVEDQWADTRRELEFWLARRGLTNSTVAADRYADAETEYGRVRQGIDDEANNLAASARTDVANARAGAVQALTTSNDPTASLSVARDRIGALSTQPTFSPLGTLFGNTLASIGAGVAGVRDARDAAAERNRGSVTARLYTGAEGGGSARNVSA